MLPWDWHCAHVAPRLHSIQIYWGSPKPQQQSHQYQYRILYDKDPTIIQRENPTIITPFERQWEGNLCETLTIKGQSTSWKTQYVSNCCTCKKKHIQKTNSAWKEIKEKKKHRCTNKQSCCVLNVCVCQQIYLVMRVRSCIHTSQNTEADRDPGDQGAAPIVLKTRGHTSRWQLRAHPSRRRRDNPHGVLMAKEQGNQKQWWADHSDRGWPTQHKPS